MKLHSTLAKILFTAPFLVSYPAFGSTQQGGDLIHDIPINRYIKHTTSNGLGAIIPGSGFSHDTQQIPPNTCYDTIVTATTGQQGTINLNTAMSFSDFQKQMHFNVEVEGGFGMFSAEADADYLRSIQDLDYSLSLNYSEFLYDTVMDRLVGPGQKALTESGKEIYNDPKINKYFGVLCGDDFISAYQQGASLLMGINIRFNSHFDKEQFNAHASASFGNLISASTTLQTMSQQYNLHGTVIIQAFQKGGNPAELSKILSKDTSNTYYALSCDLQHMDSCVKAANGLLTYAVENFPKQISFNPDKGLVPLGSGFIQHDPIAEYGLTPPPSLVSKEVLDNRIYLASALKENQYYQQKLDALIMGYPVAWDHDSEMYKLAVKLYKKARNNIDAITVPASPDDGALKCYNHPAFCQETTQSIKEKIQPITKTDLQFLDPLRYAVSSNFCGNWYPVNRLNYFMHYDPKGWYHGDILFSLQDKTNMTITLTLVYPQTWTTLRGSLPFTPSGYIGRAVADNGAPLGATMSIINNPYWFDVYKPENDLRI
jgi:hypothetical protein